MATNSTRPRPAPSSREAAFEIEELFFSTTDRKGHITSGNDVFMRVSGYERDEMIGKAHNIVRHPDMPRAAFKVFWDYLEQERPVAAYVKNLSSDGSYYWVLALAVPVDGGYVSIRLKPTSELFATARSIYSELTALEREVEGNDPKLRKQAIERSRELLLERLAEAGYDSYDAFMYAAVPAEVQSREALLTGRGSGRLGRDAKLTPMLESCSAAHRVLAAMLANSNSYATLKQTLPEKGRFVLNLAEEIRLFSLNARLVATRLADRGAAMGAIASLMRDRSDAAEPVIHELNEQIEKTLEQLDDLGFRIAGSKLQAEMMMVFIREALDAGAADREQLFTDLGTLGQCLTDGIERLFGMSGLDAHLSALMGRVRKLEQDINEIGVLEMYGRVESTRMEDGSNANALFQTIGRHVAAAQREMGDLEDANRAIRFREEDTVAIRKHAARVRDITRAAA